MREIRRRRYHVVDFSPVRSVAGGCGLLATIEDAEVVRKILTHLDLPVQAPIDKPRP